MISEAGNGTLIAEENALGWLLAGDGYRWLELTTDHFHERHHRILFAEVESLHRRGQPHDPETAIAALAHAGMLEAVGGPGVVLRLAGNTIVTAESITAYVERLRSTPVAPQPGEGPPPLPDDGAPPFDYADEPGAGGNGSLDAGADESVTMTDFYAYMPAHSYIFIPSRELWPGSSVNARVAVEGKVKAADWLDEHRHVEQMTWAPGEPMVIADRLVSGGGWIDHPGCHCFNLYRPPELQHGDPGAAGLWLDHVRLVFPESAEHIVRWLAHRVQQPGRKVNHALVLGGAQGVGKDSLLEPVKYAIGHWNFAEVTPAQLLGRFNGFVKSVILRISEARDLGDVDRYAFYEHTKGYTAAPPDVLRCDEKNLREHSVMNVTGVIITSNHKTDGIFLPADDRRHYVAWSALTKEDFTNTYWKTLYAWYQSGGIRHVAAYLAAFDLSAFDAKAPPPKTAAFHDIVDANRAPEDAELADVLEALGNRPAVTITDLTVYANESFREWLKDRRNRRQIPHRLETAGYVPVRNDADQHDGQWKVAGKRQTIYARRELTVRDRIAAAAQLCRQDRA